CGQGTNVPTF
nr:immunoglobulin light chain junction region [Macaca mulatta]MOW12988.1 immunoglobulin light chain junction region [Macaca mulatta]